MVGPAIRLATKHTGIGSRLGVKLHLPKASVVNALGWGGGEAWPLIPPPPLLTAPYKCATPVSG